MKFFRIFLCVPYIFCVLCGSAFSAFGLDREAFSITRYDLNATVEPDQQRLAVRGAITVRNDSDSPQRSVVLQISSSLHWISIQLDGKSAGFVTQTYISDIDHTGALTEAIVELPHAIAPKQTLDLQVGYEGTITQDATRLTRIGVPEADAKRSDWDEIGKQFTAVRGVGKVAWYPIATEAASLSDGNSVFQAIGRWKQREAEAEMKVSLCNRVVTGQEVSAPSFIFMNDAFAGVRGGGINGIAGLEATHCTDYRFPRLGNTTPVFVMARGLSTQGKDVLVHYLPQHKSGADDFGLALDETGPTVGGWFGNRRTGDHGSGDHGSGDRGEKPGADSEVIDLPDADDAPYESGNVLLMPLNASDTEYLLAAVRLQTRAAFPSPRPWIAEGLAGYAQAAFMQEEKNRAAAIAYMRGHRAALVESEKENVAEGDEKAAAYSLLNNPDGFYVEAKAMNVWWMLRDMVGEQALTAALHNYKASDDTRADYMQKLIETQAHRDLSWFFDDWVYRDRGLPEFHIISVFPRQIVNGGYMVTVTIENTGGASAEVPVTLHMAEGTANDRLIVPGKSKTSIRILTPMRPEEATVNDGSVPETNAENNSFRIESLNQ